MSPQDADEPARPLPPRPNLGPEPYPAPVWPSPFWALLLLPILVAAAWRFGRMRRRAIGRAKPADAVTPPSPLAPADRLAALAARIRRGLSLRFGIAGESLTTEEVGAALLAIPPDPGNGDGAFPRDRAIAVLRAADFAKFSAEPISDLYLVEAEALAAPVLEALADGAISSHNGR